MANTEAGSAYITIMPSMKNFGRELKSGIEGSTGGARRLMGGVTKAAAAAGAATVALGKKALDAYSEYEQMTGGVAKLYGNANQSLKDYAASQGKSVDAVRKKWKDNEQAQKIVMDNAARAYDTAGLSMNAYMDQATKFSASLIKSVGGNTVEAAKLTDVAMRDMSDNVNTFGSSMQDVQNAYQGFSKQNYTMLDNLRLGYGGTKTEMQKLVEDASKMKDEQKQLNLTVKDGSLEFGNIVKAIDVVQKHQQIYGTTAREGATTIEGSVNRMKAAWDNWVTGLGRDDADMGELTDQLIDSVGKVYDNVAPRITTIFTRLWDELPDAAGKLLGPKAEEFVANLQADAQNVGQGLIEAWQPVAGAVSDITGAFGSLSSEQQQAVVKTGLETAALAAMGVQAAKTGTAVGRTFAGAMNASRNLTGAAAANSLALGGLKGGVIGLGATTAAVVGVAMYDQWRKAQERIELTADATRSFSDLQGSVQASISQTGDKARSLAGNAVDYDAKLGDLLTSIKKSNDDFVTSMDDAATGAQTLDGYLDTISRLANSGKKLSGKQQADLKLAVDGYNKATGSSVKIIDIANGKLDTNTGKLYANAAAWEHNAKMQAMSALAQDTEKQIAETELQKKAVDAKISSDQKELDLLKEKWGAQNSADALRKAGGVSNEDIDNMARLEGELERNKKSSQDLQTTLDSEKQKRKDIKGAVEDETNGYKKASDQVSSLTKAMNGFGKGAVGKIKATGSSVKTLAWQLQNAGVKTKDLKSLGAKNFANLYTATKGNVDKMKSKISEYNKAKVKDKHAKVDAKGNIISGSAKKRTEDYNKTKAGNKRSSAESHGDITSGHAKGQVDRYRNTKAGNKSSRAQAHGNIIAGGPQQQVQRYNDRINGMHNGRSTATASGNVLSGGPADAIANFMRQVSGMHGKEVTVKTVFENVTKNIEETIKKVTHRGASGGMFKMAAGGIATGPTMLNSNTLIGEAGTEAWFQQGRTARVVPLSNRRYVRPFARAVAYEMGPVGNRVGGSVYNITVNAGSGDGNAIARDIRNALAMYERM